MAALGSWLDARAAGGRWLLRIEDLDQLRNQPGAEQAICAALHAHGLTWDGTLVRQSERLALYQEALARLCAHGHAYPCACSRREVEEAGGRYPGTCREGLAEGRPVRAWRMRTDGPAVTFRDRRRGLQQDLVAASTGDVVLRRADGIFAYQLAVVVDDGVQGITDVVRGADLYESTARQCLLQSLLGLPQPRYLHLPLALGANGQKLSKQNRAPALDPAQASENLVQALQHLGQPLPEDRWQQPASWSVEAWLDWAVTHWAPDRIPLAAPQADCSTAGQGQAPA